MFKYFRKKGWIFSTNVYMEPFTCPLQEKKMEPLRGKDRVFNRPIPWGEGVLSRGKNRMPLFPESGFRRGRKGLKGREGEYFSSPHFEKGRRHRLAGEARTTPFDRLKGKRGKRQPKRKAMVSSYVKFVPPASSCSPRKRRSTIRGQKRLADRKEKGRRTSRQEKKKKRKRRGHLLCPHV